MQIYPVTNYYNTGRNSRNFKGFQNSKRILGGAITSASIAAAASQINESLKMDDKRLSVF